jgi:hypothetical protein
MSAPPGDGGRIHRAVRLVLLCDQDPIGISGFPEARDEYNARVPSILGLLLRRARPEEIADHVLRIEVTRMGLEGDPRRSGRVAARLIEVAGPRAG